jgi:hypothetical protein
VTSRHVTLRPDSDEDKLAALVHVNYGKYAGKLGRTSAAHPLLLHDAGGCHGADSSLSDKAKPNPFLETGVDEAGGKHSNANPYGLVKNALLGNMDTDAPAGGLNIAQVCVCVCVCCKRCGCVCMRVILCVRVSVCPFLLRDLVLGPNMAQDNLDDMGPGMGAGETASRSAWEQDALLFRAGGDRRGNSSWYGSHECVRARASCVVRACGCACACVCACMCVRVSFFASVFMCESVKACACVSVCVRERACVA